MSVECHPVRRCCPPIEHSLSKAEPCDEKHSERDYTRDKKGIQKSDDLKLFFFSYRDMSQIEVRMMSHTMKNELDSKT